MQPLFPSFFMICHPYNIPLEMIFPLVVIVDWHIHTLSVVALGICDWKAIYEKKECIITVR